MNLNILHCLSIVLCLLPTTLFSKEKKGSQEELLLQNIENEIKLINSAKSKRATLLHRLFELHVEKVYIVEKLENRNFLDKSLKTKTPLKKHSYFQRTRFVYKKAIQLANSLIRRAPRYRRLYQVYHSLGQLSVHLEGGKRAKENFLKALRYTNIMNRKEERNIRVDLAEYYYNEKKFQHAIGQYQLVFKRTKDDMWASKHYYNYSWCLFKTSRYQKAKRALEKSYSFNQTSSEKKTSLNQQIYKSIGIFFFHAKAFIESLSWYKANTPNPSHYLIKLAKYVKAQGIYEKSLQSLNLAYELMSNKKKWNLMGEFYFQKLSLFNEFKKKNLLFKESLNFAKSYKSLKFIKDFSFNRAVDLIKKEAGLRQVILMKAHPNQKIWPSKILKLYQALIILDQKNSFLYRYYQGETIYAQALYRRSLKFYRKSISLAEKNNPVKLKHINNSIRSILSAATKAKFNKVKMKNKYFIYSHKKFIRYWPKSQKASIHYIALFNIYRKSFKIEKATNVVLDFHRNRPQNLNKQKELFKYVLDFHIKNKNSTKLNFWIQKLKTGLLSYSRPFIKSLVSNLAGILFDQAKKLEQKGSFSKAIAIYQTIYNTKNYPRKIRGDSAFNNGILNLKINQVEVSFSWLLKSLSLFNKKETASNLKTMSSMASAYLGLQNFREASSISSLSLSKHCWKNNQTIETFSSVYVSSKILLNDLRSWKDFTVQKSYPCLSKQKNFPKILKMVAENYFLTRKYENLIQLLNKNLNKDVIRALSIKMADRIYFNDFNSHSSRKMFLTFLKKVNFSRYQMIQKSMKKIESLKSAPQTDMERSDYVQKKQFSIELFSQNLAKKSQSLSKLQDDISKFARNAPSFYSIEAYYFLKNRYQSFLSSLDKVKAVGMGPDYQKAFEKELQGLKSQIRTKLKEASHSIDSFVERERVFLRKTAILKKDDRIDISGLSTPSKYLSIPMDRFHSN